MDSVSHDLDERIRRFISGSDRPSPIAFERLALDVYAYQYERNSPYRRYCDRLGRGPANVRRWHEAPAIPAASFADVRLACFPADRAALTFFSSGTGSAGEHASRHELETSALYDISLLAQFKSRVLPDTARIRLAALAPSFADSPHSSLSYMISKISQVFGTQEDAFFMLDGRLAFESVVAALRSAGEPVLLFGTAFAFVHLIDHCFTSNISLKLPLGSRIVETGGFKGKSRQVAREQLYAWFFQIFGVPRAFCVSEYGMCELGSQWYDANLSDYFEGRAPRPDTKIGPHWTRTLIVDPVSAEPLPQGQTGLLRVFDLANRGSVSAVLTGDLARDQSGGFELLGRFRGAPPKGCSIAVDASLAADGV